MVATCTAHSDGADDHQLVQMLGIWKLGNRRGFDVTAFEHLVEVHLGHTAGGVVGVVIALVGVFCASGPELSQGLPLKPLLLALGAAAGFGCALTFIAMGSQSSALLTMVSMRSATFFITIALAIKFKTTGKFNKQDMPALIFIGAADFIANLLLGIACTKGLVSIAMVFGSLYPIATAILAFKFLHESM